MNSCYNMMQYTPDTDFFGLFVTDVFSGSVSGSVSGSESSSSNLSELPEDSLATTSENETSILSTLSTTCPLSDPINTRGITLANVSQSEPKSVINLFIFLELGN